MSLPEIFLPVIFITPNPLLVCGALILILVAYTLTTVIYNLHFHPLSSFPGPFHYRASPIPHLLQEWRGNTVHKWSQLHAQYGEVVRISPNQLSYISVNAWRDIYGARGPSPSSTSSTSATSYPPGPKCLSGSTSGEMLKEELVFPGDDFEFFAPAKPMISCDAVNHARHRKAVGPAFSDRAVRSYDPMLIKHTEEMLDGIQHDQEEQARTGRGVNMTNWFHFLMFDITSSLTFGKPFGNMSRREYHPWVARIFPGMKLIAWSLVIAAIPGLGRLVSWFLPRKMVDEARRHMQSIVDMVDSRSSSFSSSSTPIPLQRSGETQLDFMTHILPHVSFSSCPSPSKAGGKLSKHELYLNAQLLCIAGSETTASLLAGTTYFLSQPENDLHLNRLRSELWRQFTSEKEIIPSGLNSNSTPYLCAILNEVLRLYPPGAINMPRTVPPGGAFIDGKYVPGGSVVGIAQYAAYRSPEHWRDPEEFVPERWLSPSLELSLPKEMVSGTGADQGSEREEEVQEQSLNEMIDMYKSDRREIFKPFSHGPRNCIGQNLALAECRLIIARLFWRFDVAMVPGQRQGRWVEGQRTFLGWEKPPLYVRLHPRTHHLS